MVTTRNKTLAIAAALATAVGVAPSQGQRASSAPAWVGLYNSSLLEWLENENRLEELCKEVRQSSVQWERCRSEKMHPRVTVITVRASPSDTGRIKGTIVLTATPGRGLRAHVSSGPTASTFTPDLYDSDWGYGPYFHQTILNRQRSWFQVPLDALGGAGWINSAQWTDTADVKPVEGIISTPRGDLVVLGWTERELRARPEQPADMWCNAGEPPALRPWTETRVPLRELFNATGHLLVTIKYTRGC